MTAFHNGCGGVLLTLFLGLAGCLSTGSETTTSSALSDPSPDTTTSSIRPETSCSVVRVFYGTNRAADPTTTNTETFYGGQRGPLAFGSCEVSIPDRHEFGEVERPSIWTLDFIEDEDRHIVLQSVTPTDRDAFLNDLAREVDRSESHEAFVFIHGFNVSFAEAARRCAQMAYDLKFDGPPILYSWPSQGRLSDYVADMSAADASERPLQEFMQAVAEESKARRIHVIAHSMGNRLLTNTLARIADSSPTQSPNLFNEVILAAPDVDAEVFRREIAPRIVRATERVTIYAAEDDLALAASSRVHGGERLGQSGLQKLSFPESSRIDVIDASGVDFSFFSLGHSTYGQELLYDIRQVMQGRAAADRGLEPHDVESAWRVVTHSDAPEHSESAIRRASQVAQSEEKTEISVPWWHRLFGWWL